MCNLIFSIIIFIVMILIPLFILLLPVILHDLDFKLFKKDFDKWCKK